MAPRKQLATVSFSSSWARTPESPCFNIQDQRTDSEPTQLLVGLPFLFTLYALYATINMKAVFGGQASSSPLKKCP